MIILYICAIILKYKICLHIIYLHNILSNIFSLYPKGRKGDIGESLYYNETQLRGKPGDVGYPGLTGKFNRIMSTV